MNDIFKSRLLLISGMLFLSMLYGCFDFFKTDIQERYSKINEAATISSTDTLFSNNDIYIVLHTLGQSSIIINWGTPQFENTTSDTIKGQSRSMRLEWYSNQAIFLVQSCGTNCYWGLILPLQANSKEKLYWYPLATDKVRNLIAYDNMDLARTPDRWHSLIVENFISGKSLNIQEDFHPQPGSIEKISFNDHESVTVKWLSFDGIYKYKTVDISALR